MMQMKTKIKIRLGSRRDAAAARRAISTLEEKMTAQAMDRFLERLCEVGRQTAAEIFAGAQYDGDNDVSVTVEKRGGGYAVSACGQAVAFIEFGSGVSMPPYPADAAAQHGRGEYGQGKGANPAGWVYAGEQGTGGRPVHDRSGAEKPGIYRTRGNPPAAAMYAAAKAMREAAPELAREVFG